MEFKDYLKILSMKDGSDLYLSTGAPPCAKFHGQLKALESTTLTSDRVKEIAYSVMDQDQIAQFEAIGLFDRDDAPGAATGVPAKGHVSIEQPGRGRQARAIFQNPFDQLQNSPQACKKALPFAHGRIVG